VGYRLCFGTRGVVFCKSCDVKKVQDAGGVFNMTGEEKGGVDGKMGYINWTFCNILVQLVK